MALLDPSQSFYCDDGIRRSIMHFVPSCFFSLIEGCRCEILTTQCRFSQAVSHVLAAFRPVCQHFSQSCAALRGSAHESGPLCDARFYVSVTVARQSLIRAQKRATPRCSFSVPLCARIGTPRSNACTCCVSPFLATDARTSSGVDTKKPSTSTSTK